MKIFIITEGTTHTGMGHIGRCCSLYDAFEERGFSPVFVINGTEMARAFAGERKGVFFDWINDSNQLNSIINGADIVVIDSYTADIQVYESISKCVGIAVYIDDYVRMKYPKGVVVNGTTGAERMNYTDYSEENYLLGAKYIMLRREFWSVPIKIINKELKKILITMGGTDVLNLTPDIVSIITKKVPNTELLVVTSERKRTAEQMKELMCECDIAISAAGQTINELARCGIPSLVFKVAENQTDNIKGWSEVGFIRGETSLELLVQDINALMPCEVRKAVSTYGQRHVDGKGAMRIVKYALQLAMILKLKIRRADKYDLEALFNLANDNIVRANSFSSAPIRIQEHIAWFNRVLSSDSSRLYIFEIDGEFVAQVRFDMKSEESITSIGITEKFRGYSIGAELLKRAIAHTDIPRPITAYIKSENIASQRTFESAGYKKTEEGKWIIESL